MGRYTTTAILLAAAPRPAQAFAAVFWSMASPLFIIITLVLLGTSSCYFAHGVCSCATQDADPDSQRRHRGCVQACACTNAVLAIVWTALFGLAMAGNAWWRGSWGAWLFFALAALAAVIGSVGAQRRCDAGGPDAEEPPVVSAAKDTA
jgi:hypothetical protein